MWHLSLTDFHTSGITLAFYNIFNDFQNYVFSYGIYMYTGHCLFLSLLEHYHFLGYHIVVFQKYFHFMCYF